MLSIDQEKLSRDDLPDPEFVVRCLTQGGMLDRIMIAFEHRPGQVEMAQAVYAAFLENRVLMVEAGTGVGKSLAYGLPAAVWALAVGRKVAVSTATINLQQQLVMKDLPLVGKVLGADLQVCLVKGRANFVCMRKLRESAKQPMLVGAGAADRLHSRLLDWVEQTKDGSRSDLTFPVPEELWRQICSDADNCLGQRCPGRENCFYVLQRKKAEKAQILVVNHHLLFADLALRSLGDEWENRSVLPLFDRLIIDEAHELEDAAGAFFGHRLSNTGVMRILARLQSTKVKTIGWMPSLVDRLNRKAGVPGSSSVGAIIARVQGSISTALQHTQGAYLEAFEVLSTFIGGHTQDMSGQPIRLRFEERLFKNDAWKTAREAFVQAAASAAFLSEQLAELFAMISEIELPIDEQVQIRSSMFRIREIAHQTNDLISERQDTEVRWVQLERQPAGKIVMQSAPLDVSELLDNNLYRRMHTTVLTSATLSVKGEFTFMAERLGIMIQPEERRHFLEVLSPFDYPAQVRLAIVDDLPAPDEPAFDKRLPEAIYRIVMASGGGALVLFTSWSLMKKMYVLISKRFEEHGLLCLCQGSMSRHGLLDLFRQNQSAVLFGTESFWQGVDVIGSALRNVTIVKLPFDVPKEPLIQARMEAIARRGHSAFMTYMLPRAVIKLKQGFGRLIRSNEDRGVVVMLDRRLVTKGYGRKFLKSLPPASQVVGNMDEICGVLTRFFDQSPDHSA